MTFIAHGAFRRIRCSSGFSAFCSSDWPIANKPVRFCNEPISCFAGSPRPGTNFKDWAMNPQNKTPNTPPMPSFYFAGQKNQMIIARQILGNLLTQLPSPLKYLIQRAGGNAVSLGHRLFY